MTINANSPEEYMEQLPAERQVAIGKMRNVILQNIPSGFEEVMSYGMIGYVVPKTVYPSGYHCDPKLPLPFISIASQKNFAAYYHMGIYADENLLKWFTDEYPKYCKNKLDMGKSCIRFKKINDIPYELMGELSGKISAEQWIEIYERELKR